MKVDARVVDCSVKAGRARSRIEFEGVSASEVRDMFLQEEAAAFFPGASTFFRAPTVSGGQTFWENPLGGPPVMQTRIEPTSKGVASQFRGFLKGEATLTIYEEGGKTVLEESTVVKPNLGLNPFSLVAEAVPFFGAFPRAIRNFSEQMLGTSLAFVHAVKVKHDNAQTMAETLERRKQNPQQQ